MTAIDAFIDLINRLGTCRDTSIAITNNDLAQWPKAAVKAIKSQKLIIKARPGTSAVCTGCERNCFMPVHTPPATKYNPSSFIVCDKRSDINRVPVSPEWLIQWQCNADLLSKFISSQLGLRGSSRKTDENGRQEIGMILGDKRSQMLCFETSGMVNLVIGSSKVPLAEFIEFHEGSYTLDVASIRRQADSAVTADNRYTPSNARRETRKLDTQAMYESWRKAYRELRREKPGMSNVWYSQKIAKMDIARGRDAETIRKKMKP